MNTIDSTILVPTEEKDIPEGVRIRNRMLRAAHSNGVTAYPSDSCRVLRLVTKHGDNKVLELLGINGDNCIDILVDGETVIHAVQLDRFATALASVLPGVSKSIHEDHVFHPVVVVASGGVSLSCASGLGVMNGSHLVNVEGETMWVDDPTDVIHKLDGLEDVIRMTVGGAVGSAVADSIRSAIDLLTESVVWASPESEAAYRGLDDIDDEASSAAN